MSQNGIDLYIWQGSACLGGDLAAIHQKARQYGLDELWKGSDGGHWYGQPAPLTTIVGGARDAGIGISIWDYLYLSDPGATYYGYTVQGWQAEQGQILATMAACPPDRYYLNNEAEAEGQWQRAQAIATALRAQYPTFPFVSACLPVIRYHTASPYRQWSDAGFLQAPELYWSMFRGTVATPGRMGRMKATGPGVLWSTVSRQQERVQRLLSEQHPEHPWLAGSHLLDAPTLVQYWQEDCTTYGITTSPYIPTYMDAPLAGSQYACTDDEIVAFLAALDHTQVQRIAVWDWQHMDAAAFSRTQRVRDWVLLTQPDHRVQSLIEQAKALYSQGNDLLGQALTLLEAKA